VRLGAKASPSARAPPNRTGRPATFLSLAAVGLIFLVFAPAAYGVKSVDRYIGFAQGGLGGQLSSPRDVAVNEAGVGGGAAGDIYVADAENNRIEVFSSSGIFKFAFGRDVIAAGKAGDIGEVFEKCTLAENCKKGSLGSLGGEFNLPQGIAINQTTGDVYVRDRTSTGGNFRVQQFSATGAFIRAWGWNVVQTGGAGDDNVAPIDEFEICSVASQCQSGSSGSGVGQFGLSGSNGAGIAVAPPGSAAAGDVFVADPGNSRIEVFNSNGALDPVPTIGSAANFAADAPLHLAVDAAGVVYAADTNSSGQIDRYETAGATLMTSIESAALGGAGATEGLEADPDSDGVGADKDVLYVLRDPNAGNTTVKQFGPANEPGLAVAPVVADATHAPTEFGTSAVNGLGLNAATGKLYVSTSTGSACGGTCHGVFALDDDGTSATATATLNGTTEVGASTATLNGTLTTPEGLVDYRFEYSKDGVNWAALPEKASSVIATQAISESLTGLEANTLYRVRLAMRKVLSPSTATAQTTSEGFFLTDAVAPSAITLSVAARSDTGAKLAASVNPNGSPTTYKFQWGTGLGYGNQVPIPAGNAGSGGAVGYVTEEIGGLSPATTYHYRVIAESTQGTAIGSDMSFVTRAADPSPSPCPNEGFRIDPFTSLSAELPDCRGYEMLTPPFKSERAVGPQGAQLHRSATPAIPALDGNRVIWANPIFPLLEDQAFPWVINYMTIARDPEDGWLAHSLITKAPILPSKSSSAAPTMFAVGIAGDLGVQTWKGDPNQPLLTNASPLPGRLYTRKDGTGDEGFSNWLPDVEAATVPYGLTNPQEDKALLNDDGSWMARQGSYRGLLGASAAQDPSVTQLSGGEGGATVYLQADPPTGAISLVNGCTGTGGTSTLIPARIGVGAASDTIGTQACEQGSPASKRGAILGGGSVGPSATSSSNAPLVNGPAATAMSNDGRRVFFTSPDPGSSNAPSACATGTGAATDCPAQLFVRQYDASGANPAVRWISRSRSHSVGENGYDGAMIAGQQIGLMGLGAGFEGASRDGRIVYFRTNAPLTPDDRNGTGVAPPAGGVVSGEAANTSWDLYQYKLPASLGEDPANGTLTRISGGPAGTADPGTNTSGSSPGPATVARYISDDGKRAYFATTSPIAGADATPPQGGVTTPGGEVGNNSTRDLYLFDENLSGGARWKFIAKVGVGCASTAALDGADLSFAGFAVKGAITRSGSKCFRGTPNGDAVAFETTDRLTADDTDNAQDIYLYDARTDELTRISAPPAGVPSYGCDEAQNVEHTASLFCNGDFGFNWSIANDSYDLKRGWGGGRSYNIAEDPEGHVSVFFESRSELVPADTNGDYWDSYRWRGGKLALVSPGDSEDDSYYSGNSLDGRDVFIQTARPIDPREIDPKDNDVYDARIGGGFKYTPPPAPCDVLAHECRGTLPTPAAESAPASRDFSGPGNVNENVPKPNCGKGRVLKHGKCVKRRHKAGHKKRAHANRGSRK